jgi:hypothetical protein
VTSGFIFFLLATLRWVSIGFGNLPIELAIRLTIPSLLLVAIGSQFIITTLLRESLGLIVPKQGQTRTSSIGKSSE